MVQSYVYLSKSKFHYSSEDVERFYLKFSKKNKAHKISGFLIFDRLMFLQYIEGPKHHIENLMGKIREDDRHQVIQELSRRKSQKIFEEWSVKYLSYQALNQVYPENKLVDILSFSVKNENLLPNWSDLVWNLIANVKINKKTV